MTWSSPDPMGYDEARSYHSPSLSFGLVKRGGRWSVHCGLLRVHSLLLASDAGAAQAEAVELLSRRLSSVKRELVKAIAAEPDMLLKVSPAQQVEADKERYRRFYEPSDRQCRRCGKAPTVPLTGKCGSCTFGTALPADGNWYNMEMSRNEDR
jgi:ribosomal protein L37E